MEQYTVLLKVTINISKPLIVWNNLFGVDDPLTEKPGGWFAQADTENSPSLDRQMWSIFLI